MEHPILAGGLARLVREIERALLQRLEQLAARLRAPAAPAWPRRS